MTEDDPLARARVAQERILKNIETLVGTATPTASLTTAGGTTLTSDAAIRKARRAGAEENLQAKADEIRKAKPHLTPAQAYARAVDENPALYREYRDTMR